MPLREYQQTALERIKRFLTDTDQSGVVVIPTAGGKTIVFATLIRDLLRDYPLTRICILAHRFELLTQGEDKLLQVWPEAPCGVLSASLNRWEWKVPVLFASIQTIYKRAYDLEPFDLLIVDEAHLTPPKAETMYGRFIKETAIANPSRRLIGFTATPFRLDNGYIYKHKDASHPIFDELIYQADVRELVEDGWLCPVVSRQTQSQIDLSNVHVRGGEFVATELEKASLQNVAAAVDELCERGADRSSWLIFSSGAKHADAISQILDDRGIDNAIVDQRTPIGERREIVDAFAKRKLRAVVNINCLTTGLDVTCIDLIAIIRATESASLYVQMVGRGMRLDPTKSSCAVLDYGGNICRHGPIDNLVIATPSEAEDGAAPFKLCPDCGVVVHASKRVCDECGHQFPPPEPKHDTRATAMPILSVPIWEEQVDSVSFSLHHKEGFPPSLRVSYRCGLHIHNEWVCIAHKGGARTRAVEWWRKWTGESYHFPTTAEEARRRLEIKFPDLTRVVESVSVRSEGKFYRVLGVKFRVLGSQEISDSDHEEISPPAQNIKNTIPAGMKKRGKVYYAWFTSNGQAVRKRLSTDLRTATQMLKELRIKADIESFKMKTETF